MFSFLFFVYFSLISSSFNFNFDSTQIEGFNDITQWIVEPQLYKEDSALCRRDLAERPNIIEMLDATSKLQSGILIGNYIDLGSFDECVQITYNSSEEVVIAGKYCLIRFKVDSSYLHEIISHKYEAEEINQTRKGNTRITAGLAVCMPESCSQIEIENAIQYLQERNIISLEKISVSCTSNTKEPFNIVDWIAIGIYIGFCFLLVVSTGYDVYLVYHEDSKKNELLLSFSIYTNGQKLLSIKPKTPENTDINCLHGLRFFSIAAVIMFHRSIKETTNPLVNTEEMYEWTRQIRSTYISGLSVAVDTFLVMSGLLLSRNFLKERDLDNSFNIFKFYVKRSLRLTPAFAATVLMMASLAVRFGDGPLWKSTMGHEQETCIRNWWYALFYIQNYNSPFDMCLLHSWYLSIDTQLFVLSPLILIPLWKFPKHAVRIIVILLLASIGVLIGILLKNDFNYNILDPNLEESFGENELFAKVYLPTHTRFGPWLAGVLLGYVLHKTKQSIKYCKKLAVGIWFIVIIAMLLIVLGAHSFTSGESYSNAESIAYFSLQRISWAICICWIIFACYQGRGGVVNWLLSWDFWQPISRLSYCMYLIHYPLQIITNDSRTPSYFSDLNLIFLSMCDITIAAVAAILWSLAFEQPFLVIVKQIFKKKEQLINGNGL